MNIKNNRIGYLINLTIGSGILIAHHTVGAQFVQPINEAKNGPLILLCLDGAAVLMLVLGILMLQITEAFAYHRRKGCSEWEAGNRAVYWITRLNPKVRKLLRTKGKDAKLTANCWCSNETSYAVETPYGKIEDLPKNVLEEIFGEEKMEAAQEEAAERQARQMNRYW